jgi:NADPH-dependent glutamate synthase beta subunit-like oxidoreductase
MEREAEALLNQGDRIERRQGVAPSLDALEQEGFAAILLATGLRSSQELPSEARPATGVVSALEFLRQVKTGRRASGTVLVIGGGNTAMDAARSALLAGAEQVSVVYRRSFAEMPAWPDERDHAVKSGVNFLILTAPVGYEVDAGGRLTGLRVCRTRLGEPDASGRRRPEAMAETEHVLPADLVVEAIGQQMDEATRQATGGLEVARSGRIATRPGSLMTSRAGVFVAGDVANGGTTVVQAVAEGARAAREIDVYLSQS